MTAVTSPPHSIRGIPRAVGSEVGSDVGAGVGLRVVVARVLVASRVVTPRVVVVGSVVEGCAPQTAVYPGQQSSEKVRCCGSVG